jgi:DNA-binding transcriptional LysR family regulator
MTLWQLKTFATVAREGSFTKAANALNISQPSVSSLVIGLQKELGVKLFEKFGMKPHLTEAGGRVLQLVESALATIEKIPEEMDEVRGLKKGRIRVGGSVVAGGSFLPAAVRQFERTHPGFEITLKIQRTGDLERMLLEGELDVANLGFAPRSSLVVAEPFREEEVAVIAPPNHPLTKKRSVPLKLLATQHLISTEKGVRFRDMVEQKFVAQGLSFAPSIQVNLDIGSRDVVRSAVASGLGIGFLSKCHVVNDVRAGRIKILNVPELKLKRAMYLAVHRNRQHSALVQSFTEYLARYRE